MSLDDLKNRIKDELPISMVIGNYLPLKKQGNSLLALCPFHQDSKPSMNVNDSKKMYKCFACGAGGDAITFVQKYRNLNFLEALQEICQKNGIKFDSYNDDKLQNPKILLGKKIIAVAMRLYRKYSGLNGETPFKNFLGQRKILPETATTYSLGYAPHKNALVDYLESIKDEAEKDEAFQVAMSIGLIKKNPEYKTYYDTFRDRIMFPIWDQKGDPIGFTSRALLENQKPKYLNSIESILFNKGNILYGLHLAKDSIREKDAVILVEGNMDQIALHQFGFKNSVAIMGTALQEQTLHRLTLLTKNFFLALDNDAAGLNAAKKINVQLLEKGMIPLYISFDPVKDADDFLKEFGQLELQKKLEEAKPMIDILLDRIFPPQVPELAHKKLELLQTAMDLISPLKRHLLAYEKLTQFSKRLGLSSTSEQIIKSYEQFLEDSEAQKKKFLIKKSTPAPISDKKENMHNDEMIGEEQLPSSEINAPHIDNITQNIASSPAVVTLLKCERLLLQELVQSPEALSSPKLNEILDLVPSHEVKKYITKLKKLVLEIDDSEYVFMVTNLLTNEDVPLTIKEIITSSLFNFKTKNLDDPKYVDRMFFDFKINIKKELLNNKKKFLKFKQSDFQTEEEYNKLLIHLNMIDKELNELKKLKFKFNDHPKN